MIGLICFVLTVLASPFKLKSRLEAENAVLRHQLIVLRRRLISSQDWLTVNGILIPQSRERGEKDRYSSSTNQIRTYWDAVRPGPNGKEPTQLSEHGVKSVHSCPTISACALHCNNLCKTAIRDGDRLN
jgi:hypothetical protein